MGVAGRDVGVGMVLMDAVVLTLLLSVPTDSREPDRTFVLLAKAEADVAVVVAFDFRKAEGPVGLMLGLDDLLGCSLSLFFTGDGESSIISTQPEDSPAGDLLKLFRFTASSSKLRRRRSSTELFRSTFALGAGAAGFAVVAEV